MKTILVIEDDKDLNDGIKYILQSSLFFIKQAHSIEEAKVKLNESTDLILLDINLPDGNGLEFCMKIRETMKVPIIFISANDTDINIITSLELGGDDYITKPFNLMVLRAKVNAWIRRYEEKSERNIYKDNIFFFDFDKMLYIKNEQILMLSNTEQKILKLLIINKENIISKEKLIDYIWATDSEFVEENSLTVGIKRLRKKIEDDPSNPECIKNVYGIGYTWRTKK